MEEVCLKEMELYQLEKKTAEFGANSNNNRSIYYHNAG